MIIVLFSIVSCKNKDQNIGVADSYMLTEKHISEDCSAYQMRFKKGDYMFNFALSGTCKKLTMKDYTNEYSMYLDLYKDSLIVKKGSILIQYYGIEGDTKKFQDSIIAITKRNFKTNVSVVESGNEFFRIKVDNFSK
ncbi:hypothetical protein HYN56_09835 [Flavobacterium crocinum]|uniref:Uncharacterized protein n=2 Tax=Flavobacterium crocinum TaxID=2183896 RepID=A0A2S1YKB8_9FLAO|nr:hypothetical protein HYN56_09835 [Flavobacterium crocinum]